MIKNSLLTLILLTCTLSFYCHAEGYTAAFHSENYLLEIKVNCAEGNVSCDDVTMKSRNLKDNYAITLQGKTINSNCPDICDFKGYFFEKEGYEYYLYLQGDDYYAIKHNDKTLVYEKIIADDE